MLPVPLPGNKQKTIAKIAPLSKKSLRVPSRGLPGTEGRIPAPLFIEAMSGIGPAMAKILYQGIRTLENSQERMHVSHFPCWQYSFKMILRAQGKEVLKFAKLL